MLSSKIQSKVFAIAQTLLIDDKVMLHEIGLFDAVKRDSRQRTITMAYLAEYDSSGPGPQNIQAGDDASETKWFNIWGILYNEVELAFDHKQIVEKGIDY